MAYFETKKPDLGKFWGILQWKMLVYYTAIWFILRLFGVVCRHSENFKIIFIWFLFLILACCTKKIWQPRSVSRVQFSGLFFRRK
jgi:hypothetical protein